MKSLILFLGIFAFAFAVDIASTNQERDLKLVKRDPVCAEELCRENDNCGVMNYCGIDYDCGGCESHFSCQNNLCVLNCVDEDPCDGVFCGTKTVCETEYDCSCEGLSVCSDGQCEDVECVVSDDCPSNQVCSPNFECGCEDPLVTNENGDCIADPCLDCGINTVCHTGRVCYCIPGYQNTNGQCQQITDPVGDQTVDLQFLQTLPAGDDVPLNFDYIPDGGLQYTDSINRETFLRWLASEDKTANDFTFQFTVKASNGAFGAFFRNQQFKDETSENDGFGFILANIGNSPTITLCKIDRGERTCAVPVAYPFSVNTETLVTVTFDYLDGGFMQIAYKVGGGRRYRSSLIPTTEFPAAGFIALYFDPTATPGPSFSQVSLVSGAEVTIAEYSCLTDAEWSSLYEQLTGLQNAPSRSNNENGKCFEE